ncbi:MAG: hypothetical protein HC855_00485 [Rhizobiales bacterium]|nr:hypothetical protein [Hyphomicrobiales bacterium]
MPTVTVSPETPAFTLTLPGTDSPDERVHAIQRRGNLPLMIAGCVLAEITHDDLMESWQEAVSLSMSELNNMAELAGRRLTELLDDNLESGDLTDLVTDAAVLFLLALRRHGVDDANRIPPCTVMWNGQEGRERVLMRA